MAATLKHQIQHALAEYKFASVDHPLILAYSDYVFAKSNALPYHTAKARLVAELRLEVLVSQEMERAA